MKNFEFEKKVIDVILNTIKTHQEYLTKEENLPQLAKLGYMYNLLWYSGRICWGYNGIISKSNDDSNEEYYGQCEDNPKYKIEMCEPKNGEIENLIYDAWGMHISEGDEMQHNWEKFSTIVLKGKKLSNFEKKWIKPKKTFDEWVEILMDDKFQYSSLFPNKRRVADDLLCVIGNEYGYKDGYVIREAGGADQDLSEYGDWENAKFRKDIKKVVDGLMKIPQVKQTVQTAYLHIKGIYDNKRKAERERDIKAFGMPYDDFIKTKKGKSLFGDEDKYHPYYPICEYSAITHFDKNTHPSYIKAGIEVCKEILANEDKEQKSNVKFAEKYLKKFESFLN